MVVSGLLGGVSSCCSCSCSSCRWVGIGRAGLQQAARRRRHVGGERPLARDLDGRLVAVEDGMLVLWVLLGRRLVGVVVLDGPRAGGAGSAGIVDGELRDKVLECYLRLAQGASWKRIERLTHSRAALEAGDLLGWWSVGAIGAGLSGTLWERDLRPLWLDAGVLDEMEQRLGRDGRGLHDLGQKVDLGQSAWGEGGGAAGRLCGRLFAHTFSCSAQGMSLEGSIARNSE